MLPKPQHCGEEWLGMCATKGGRLCQKCNKIIFDFSKMNWSDIEKIQHQHNNTLCGMYSNAQLSNWGVEVPRNNLPKIISTVALITSINVSSGNSQSVAYKDTSPNLAVRGVVTGLSIDGGLDTLAFAHVQLKNTSINTVGNSEGEFKLELPGQMDTLNNPIIVISYTGYANAEILLEDLTLRDIYINPILEEAAFSTVYAVEKPSIGQKIKWQFKKWFGRKV